MCAPFYEIEVITYTDTIRQNAKYVEKGNGECVKNVFVLSKLRNNIIINYPK